MNFQLILNIAKKESKKAELPCCRLLASWRSVIWIWFCFSKQNIPPPAVFELGRMDRRLLTNVNGAGRPSRFPLSESLIEIALQNPMREGAGSLPNLPRGVASIESWGRLDENSALASQPWG